MGKTMIACERWKDHPVMTRVFRDLRLEVKFVSGLPFDFATGGQPVAIVYIGEDMLLAHTPAQIVEQARTMFAQQPRRLCVLQSTACTFMKIKAVQPLLAIDLGASVTCVEGVDDAARLIAEMALQADKVQTALGLRCDVALEEGGPPVATVAPTRHLVGPPKQEQLLACATTVPGLSEGRATALLGAVGSVGALVDASADELARVRGIGGATAERVHDFFHRPVNAAPP